jgi:ApaG protein
MPAGAGCDFDAVVGALLHQCAAIFVVTASRLQGLGDSVQMRAMIGETPDYRIDIAVRSVYIDDESEPDANRYVFAYTVTIRNVGTVPAQLLTRHWVITDADGKVQEVRGDGVVGEQPRLVPGEDFQYTSAALIETPVGTMGGSYQMVADDGVSFDAEIPLFRLSIPNILH